MKNNQRVELLVRIAKHSDESAFERLYYTYYKQLFGFAMHMVRSEIWSEEIVSDVFFNIWQNRENLLRIEDLDAYLFKSVKNKALDYIDKINSLPQCEALSVGIDYIPGTENPENMVIDKELSCALLAAVESLPEKCRIIFKLAREDGLRYKQIAEILNISIKTIDAQMAIATQKISAIIKKYIES